MSDLKTLFSEAACPVPDAQSGDQGIGGGLDAGAGPNGLKPIWDNPVCPTPTGGEGGGPFGNTSRFSSVDGGTHQGANETADVTSSRNTIDKR